MAAHTTRRLAAAALLGLVTAAGAAAQEQPTVRAVLFFSPTCPHCHTVMTTSLPALLQQHGAQLRIVALNVAEPEGQDAYLATIEHFRLPESRLGVPALVVGDSVLVGSWEIPNVLPGMIAAALAGTGTDWPAVPAVRRLLERQGIITATPPPSMPGGPELQPTPETRPKPVPASEPEPRTAEKPPTAEPRATAAVAEPDAASPAATPDSTAGPGTAAPAGATATTAGMGPAAVLELDTGASAANISWRGRFALDPAGNTIAVAALLLMLAAVALAATCLLRPGCPLPRFPAPVVLLMALAGIGVAAYLAWVELTGQEAVCGPVGHCNVVQQSPYARLFGRLPVGLLGVAGYLAVLAGYLVGPRLRQPGQRRAVRLTWLATLVGVAFSAWLTFLEPFVIGATCLWCVSSALIMTVLLLATSAWARSLQAL